MRSLKLQKTDTYGIEIEFVTDDKEQLEDAFKQLKNQYYLQESFWLVCALQPSPCLQRTGRKRRT